VSLLKRDRDLRDVDDLLLGLDVAEELVACSEIVGQDDVRARCVDPFGPGVRRDAESKLDREHDDTRKRVDVAGYEARGLGE
jgi:hypothetical protein